MSKGSDFFSLLSSLRFDSTQGQNRGSLNLIRGTTTDPLSIIATPKTWQGGYIEKTTDQRLIIHSPNSPKPIEVKTTNPLPDLENGQAIEWQYQVNDENQVEATIRIRVTPPRVEIQTPPADQKNIPTINTQKTDLAYQRPYSEKISPQNIETFTSDQTAIEVKELKIQLQPILPSIARAAIRAAEQLSQNTPQTLEPNVINSPYKLPLNPATSQPILFDLIDLPSLENGFKIPYVNDPAISIISPPRVTIANPFQGSLLQNILGQIPTTKTPVSIPQFSPFAAHQNRLILKIDFKATLSPLPESVFPETIQTGTTAKTSSIIYLQNPPLFSSTSLLLNGAPDLIQARFHPIQNTQNFLEIPEFYSAAHPASGQFPISNFYHTDLSNIPNIPLKNSISIQIPLYLLQTMPIDTGATEFGIPILQPQTFPLQLAQNSPNYQWPEFKALFQNIINQTHFNSPIINGHDPENDKIHLTATMMLFLSRVKKNDPAAWLKLQSLDDAQSSRANLMDTLEQIKTTLPKDGFVTEDHDNRPWRSHMIPVHTEHGFEKMMLHVRDEPHTHQGNDDKTEQGSSKPMRFIFDLGLSRMGSVQIDGFLKDQRLDIVLRTITEFHQDNRQMLRYLYQQALRECGLSGQLEFQNDPHKWFNVGQKIKNHIVTR
jgi:hypothetical protein